MPAPTALLQPTTVPEAVPLPSADQDDEVLLDVQDTDLTDPSAALPPSNDEDTEMVVDEEGRPRFAPGKDVVSFWMMRQRLTAFRSSF
jgi:RNA-binding protein PNO1